MSRSIQAGDFVHITLGDFSQYYQIRLIANDGIYISPPDDPYAQSVLIFDPNIGQWTVYGTTQEFQIDFLSKEDYDGQTLLESGLLKLPDDLIITIALNLPLADITRMCQTHSRLNELICSNQRYWQLRYLQDIGQPRYLQDIGQPETEVINWKQKYMNNITSDIYVFGNNQYGQLGLGVDDSIPIGPVGSALPESSMGVPRGPTQLPGYRAKLVACGPVQTVFIDQEDDIHVFGRNRQGQLGLGDTDDRSIPTKLPGYKAKSIAGGTFHTVFIDQEDDIYVFGRNDKGQLGLGDITERLTPTKLPGYKAKMVACNGYRTIFIDQEDDIYVFGNNEYGQLGLGDKINRLIPTKLGGYKAKLVACGSYQTVFIDQEDDIYVLTGVGSRRLIPIKLPGYKAKMIACGSIHTIFMDQEDDIYVFGNNGSGQLGLGDTDRRLTPIKLPGYKAKMVACGGKHTVLLI